LPGGEFAWDAIGEVQERLRQRYPFVSAATSWRLTRAYGTLATDVLGDARSTADLGRHFGADLTEREVDWLVRTEWARAADDVLWRRSKLGLRLSAAESAALGEYLGRALATVS
jgi:glycerol-3-phosphate dehydrogenase